MKANSKEHMIAMYNVIQQNDLHVPNLNNGPVCMFFAKHLMSAFFCQIPSPCLQIRQEWKKKWNAMIEIL